LLASEPFEIDAVLNAENLWQSKSRKTPDPVVEVSEEPSPAENAAALADRIDGKLNQVPEKDKEKSRRRQRRRRRSASG
jgi:hypothetical protein